ncbi:MAG TPA: C-terminal binding protein [Streptosporangiaceae bacterium]|nr:C-terminal binding protein [Streptosporangiaceae bacterium]
MRVVYTDPAWALDAQGQLDPSLADLERSVLGPDVVLDIGPRDGGGYVTAGEEFLDYVRGADALVVYRAEVTEELVAAVSPRCKVIARSGVGVDNLNLPLLARSGIAGFNIPDYCGAEVSTHTVALLLALERGVCVQDRLVRADQWGIHRGGIPRRTSACDVGIVGFGRIGRVTARKLQPFYRQVLAVDPYVPDDVMAGYGVFRVGSLGDLLSRCDAIVLHCALTGQTRHLIGGTALDHVKPRALLVNTARGALVDPGCVLSALEDGRLGGFASDVFSPEDPNRCPVARKLLGRDDVVVSSHRAFLSAESEESLRRRVAAGVRSVLREGLHPPESRVA